MKSKRNLPRSLKKLERELTNVVEPELDVEEASERFAIPPGRVRKIARDVWKGEQRLSVTKFERDSDLREYFREEFDRQLRDFRACSEPGCKFRYTSVEGALAHHSLHLLRESKDRRTQRQIIRDIMELLHPPAETTVTQNYDGVLTPEEREEILRDPYLQEDFRREGLLEDCDSESSS